MRPMCVRCNIEFRVEKVGVYVKELSTSLGFYKLWAADLWECPICHHQIANGYSKHPLINHWDSGAGERLDKIESNPRLQVIECKEKP